MSPRATKLIINEDNLQLTHIYNTLGYFIIFDNIKWIS